MSGTELKDLLDRVVEPAGQMPDVVPEVVAAGRRSVRRRRIGGSALAATACAAVVASVVLVNGAPDTGATIDPAAQPTTQLGRNGKTLLSAGEMGGAACHTTEEGNTMANGRPVPDALRRFHAGSAAVLDAVLPERVGSVQAMPQVQSFCLTVDGRRQALTLRVDRVTNAEEGRCTAETASSCRERQLPNGHWATAYDGGHARTVLDRHVVTIDVFGSTAASAEELLDAFADPRFTEMVDEWASHPDWTGWGGDGRVTK